MTEFLIPTVGIAPLTVRWHDVRKLRAEAIAYAQGASESRMIARANIPHPITVQIWE
jgi:hypothetical protein